MVNKFIALWCLLGMTRLMASAQGDPDGLEKLPIYKAGALEITCIAGPHIEDWCPLNGSPANPAYEGPFRVIKNFIAETVFMRRDELLYRAKHGCYTQVSTQMRDGLIINRTHAHYGVYVDDGFMGYLQEISRQKNISFMTDLWRMALGDPWVSTCHGPLVLRRLMLMLGAAEVDLQEIAVPLSLLESLDAVTRAHMDLGASPRNKAKKAALSLAAARVFVWAKAYESGHTDDWENSESERFMIQKSATFPLLSKKNRREPF